MLGRTLLISILSTAVAIWPFADLAYAANTTQLSQTINAGTLGVDVVDGSGNSVGSPTVGFGAVTFSFDQQTGSGTLGTSSQKIRLSNGRQAPAAAWTLSVAGSAPSALWTSGGDTFDFNNATAANGVMTVDPSTGTITPTNSYTATGVTLGSSNTFLQATRDSLTILQGSTSASQPGRWDLAGITLSNTIPATQPPGTYTVTLVLTVS
ncbi:MAG: hypothetical protein HY567_01680 [Candidatus Kerfeldbacteria bacterium]|nr:hypothetical protein [Candidatus Kerfeldbacteria bacterium]